MKASVVAMALRHVISTTVDVNEIAKYYGLIGDTKEKFVTEALRLRKIQWDRMDGINE